MNLKFSNISSLQFFQLVRFSAFLLIGIAFTKTGLSRNEIGEYETVLFVAGAVSFFWLNGLIQGLLPLFEKTKAKSAQLFNAFILISFLTVLAILFLIIFNQSFSSLLLKNSQIPFLKYLLAYLFFSVPASLVEYIYLLKEKPKQIALYGTVSFALMLALVCLPAIMGYSFEYCLAGLVLSAGVRYGWLIALLCKYSIAKFSYSFLSEYLKLSFPLILSAFLSGSAQYIDGFIVTSHFDEATFAVFRYGAREFPLVLLLANAFSSAMVHEFSAKENISEILKRIKSYTTKLMHWLFPLTAIMMLVSHWLFPIVFNPEFKESATIFNIYLLLIISRLVFPQTILTGIRQTGSIAFASLLEIILNVSLSLWFVTIWGIAGIAYATVIAYVFEKIFLIIRVKNSLGICCNKYMNLAIHLTYSLLLLLIFYVIEFVIY